MEDEEGSGHSGKETIESLDERGWETHRSATKSEASDESGDEHLYNTDHESDFDLDSVHGPLFRGQTRQLSQRVEKLVLDFRQKQELFKRRRREGGTLRKVFREEFEKSSCSSRKRLLCVAS